MAVYFDPNCGKVVLKNGKRKSYLAPWRALEMAGQLIYCAQQYANSLKEGIADLHAVPEPPQKG